MTNEGKYIYCIISENRKQRMGIEGINNREVHPVKSSKAGISPKAKLFNGVNTLPYKDIAAVVSPSPIIKFDRLDKKELTSYVATHQKVNEQLMKDYALVPMAFGIIAPSVAEVQRILENIYLQFQAALKKVAGKTEFAVQVWWDQQKLIERLIKTVPEVRRLKNEASLKTSILGIPIKLKLGRLIHQELEGLKQTYIKNIQFFFNGLACESTQNKLIDDNMLANFSFLIEKTKEAELDRKMQKLGKNYEGELRFKYIGPMPPYSFSNINLSLGNFEIVDKARKLLGLGEEAPFDEIKNVYYALSHQEHPDKHQDSPEKAEEQMKKITQAYNILENYCQSCGEFVGKKEDQRYSFREKDVKNSIIVKR